MWRSGWALEAGVAAAALSLLGCDVLTGGCGDDLNEDPPARYTEGTTENGHYVSSSWDVESLLDFPPGQAIRFEHGLGEPPSSWQAYIATARDGDGAEIVLSTGEVELVSIDATALTVRNGTCADLYLLVTAESR